MDDDLQRFTDVAPAGSSNDPGQSGPDDAEEEDVVFDDAEGDEAETKWCNDIKAASSIHHLRIALGRISSSPVASSTRISFPTRATSTVSVER